MPCGLGAWAVRHATAVEPQQIKHGSNALKVVHFLQRGGFFSTCIRPLDKQELKEQTRRAKEPRKNMIEEPA